jgi:hypothetical protein
VRTAPLCFASRGFSLHAATRIEADDRPGVEKLLRYVARPPLAAGRLRILDAGTLSFALKTPWDDGTSHLILTPHELLEKLAALVPPPRVNLIRYHGVLAPNAPDRDKIVPQRVASEPPGEDPGPCCHHMPQRLAWATLLARVFSIDVTEYPACPSNTAGVCRRQTPRDRAPDRSP